MYTYYPNASHSTEHGCTLYGITAYQDAVIAVEIKEVTSDFALIRCLSALLNFADVSPEHLTDVLEDFI